MLLSALVGLMVVAVVTAVQWRSVLANERSRFELEIERTAQLVRARLGELSMKLHAARGFIEASDRVTGPEWTRFVEEVRTDGQSSPAVGLAVIRRVPVGPLGTVPPAPAGTFWRHADPIPVDGFVAPVTLHAPPGMNSAMVGYDVASRAAPRTALIAAARTNRPVATPPIRLEQIGDRDWGVVLYLPVYVGGAPPVDRDARLGATAGWIAAPIAVGWFLETLAERMPDIAAVEIRPEEHVVDGPSLLGRLELSAEDCAGPCWRAETPIAVADRTWSMVVQRPAPAAASMIAGVAPVTGVTALIVGLLVALVGSATGTRQRALELADRMTAQVRRQGSLLDATERLARLGTWEFTVGEDRVTWSDAMCAMQGVPPGTRPTLAESRGSLDDAARIRMDAAVAEAIETGEPWDLELTLHLPDGRRLVTRSLGSVEDLPDGRRRLWGALQDVTEQVEAREQLEAAWHQASAASRTKSAFLANMSHEIRTPMTAILGFVELLQEQGGAAAEPEVVDDALETIRRNGEHLLALLNDLLDLSKIEAGRMTLERLPVEMPSLIAEVTSLMRVRASAKGLFLRTRYDGELPVTIDTDPVRVRQIVSNLVGNAIKFTEVGGVTVTVRYERHDAGSGTLAIAVEDTGIGMDGEQRTRIFQAFSQGDESMTRRFGGTGLGLRISSTLAEMLGGRIDVDSTPGVGSTFTVRLDAGDVTGRPMTRPPSWDHAADAAPAETDGIDPAADPIGHADAGPAGDATAFPPDADGNREVRPEPAPAVARVDESRGAGDADRAPALRGVRVLVAEDGPDNQRLLRHVLTRAGASVRIAENGRDAVDAVAEARQQGRPFDLVLMDMQMPVMNGYRATRELRRRGHGLPIIAVTAHAMTEDRWKCIDAGCDDYATKPIDARRLVTACRSALDAAAARRQAPPAA